MFKAVDANVRSIKLVPLENVNQLDQFFTFDLNDFEANSPDVCRIVSDICYISENKQDIALDIADLIIVIWIYIYYTDDSVQLQVSSDFRVSPIKISRIEDGSKNSAIPLDNQRLFLALQNLWFERDGISLNFSIAESTASVALALEQVLLQCYDFFHCRVSTRLRIRCKLYEQFVIIPYVTGSPRLKCYKDVIVYRIMPGFRFGAVFSLYGGDPDEYHSQILVIDAQNLSNTTFLSYLRLSNLMMKDILLYVGDGLDCKLILIEYQYKRVNRVINCTEKNDICGKKQERTK